ncbi:hypothetical protein DFQ27_000569 [Actinomortierella ambigua]|uniref:Uncharacterized protein n=1 Tax=Actinomortierella ambigua TaxID=1343610 RepID=A0A9P6TW80_9FUNG|nr:hypothetical protein DFQ27_000569 [Actinomortierella ambigua]
MAVQSGSPSTTAGVTRNATNSPAPRPNVVAATTTSHVLIPPTPLNLQDASRPSSLGTTVVESSVHSRQSRREMERAQWRYDCANANLLAGIPDPQPWMPTVSTVGWLVYFVLACCLFPCLFGDGRGRGGCGPCGPCCCCLCNDDDDEESIDDANYSRDLRPYIHLLIHGWYLRVRQRLGFNTETDVRRRVRYIVLTGWIYTDRLPRECRLRRWIEVWRPLFNPRPDQYSMFVMLRFMENSAASAVDGSEGSGGSDGDGRQSQQQQQQQSQQQQQQSQQQHQQQQHQQQQHQQQQHQQQHHQQHHQQLELQRVLQDFHDGESSEDDRDRDQDRGEVMAMQNLGSASSSSSLEVGQNSERGGGAASFISATTVNSTPPVASAMIAFD